MDIKKGYYPDRQHYPFRTDNSYTSDPVCDDGMRVIYLHIKSGFFR
jgi:hypothetical protein